MTAMKWEWLKKQHEDIRGHYKWALIWWFVVGSGFTWLAHFLQAAFHSNIAGWLALAAPIFSILAVCYLLVVVSRTPATVTSTRSNSTTLSPSAPALPLPVDLHGEIRELYFYRPEVLGVSRKTCVVMKVRIVNHGPDEATITHVVLRVELGDFQRDGEVTGIPDLWRIRKKAGEFNLIFPTYQETPITPVLGVQAHKEIYKKGVPHEGWLAFEFLDFEDIEFPNAQFDLYLKDSLGGGHRITRKSMVYIREGELVVASKPALPPSPKAD